MDWRMFVLAASCSQLAVCQSSRNESSESTGSSTDVTATPSDDTSASSSAGTTGAPTPVWCIEAHTIDAADGTLDDVAVVPLLADVDGDGLPELWTAVTTTETSELAQYHVDPNGVAITGASHVLGRRLVLFADINGDGHDDVVLESSGTWEWVDLSSGTPGAPHVVEDPGHTYSWIDADGDGDADAFRSGWPDLLVELWINDGSGSLTLASQLAVENIELNIVERVHLVADGVFAAELTNEAIGFGMEYGVAELVLDGGTLQVGARTPSIGPTLERAMDFDHDGHTDFVTGGVLWRGLAAGASPIVLSDAAQSVKVGDFMGLGAPAVLIAGSGGMQVHLDPLDPTPAPVAVVGEMGQVFHVVDFDGDGKDQIIDAWKDDYDDPVRYRLLDVRRCE